jgi:hypothetical protein
MLVRCKYHIHHPAFEASLSLTLLGLPSAIRVSRSDTANKRLPSRGYTSISIPVT